MTEYRASKTLSQFHKSDDFVRGVVGPIGSGKSSAMVSELIRRAKEQEPDKGGVVRCSRWAIIRNTYRELLDTTCATFFHWLPQKLGDWNKQDMTFRLWTGDMDVEFLFRALDRPGDEKKLLSLELTGAWINEAKELPKSVVDMLQGRLGRYPAVINGGATWSGLIMDTNPPDVDHWWYRLFEEEKPEGWSLYKQPSAISLEAENLKNLPDNYYQRLMAGKTEEWVKVYVKGEYGYVTDGKPVYPEYSDSVHVANELLRPVRNEPIFVGVDFGLTPAAVFGQRLSNGRWIWFEELVTQDMGALRFAELLGRVIREKYLDYEFEIYGDPAGEQRAQTDETTPFEIMKAKGIPAQPAPTNDFVIRRESVANALSTIVDGKPMLLISPACTQLRKGMAGGYHYKRIQVAGDERYRDKPDKGPLSHVCEGGQYLMVGAGEGQALIQGKMVAVNNQPTVFPSLGLG